MTVFTFIPLAFFAVGLWAFLHVEHAQKAWKKTSGVVLKSEALKKKNADSNELWSVAIEYDYNVADKKLKGTNYWVISAYATSDHDETQEIVNSHPAGSKVDVYYDPDNPNESALNLDHGYFVVFLILPFLFWFMVANYVGEWLFRRDHVHARSFEPWLVNSTDHDCIVRQLGGRWKAACIGGLVASGIDLVAAGVAIAYAPAMVAWAVKGLPTLIAIGMAVFSSFASRPVKVQASKSSRTFSIRGASPDGSWPFEELIGIVVEPTGSIAADSPCRLLFDIKGTWAEPLQGGKLSSVLKVALALGGHTGVNVRFADLNWTPGERQRLEMLLRDWKMIDKVSLPTATYNESVSSLKR